MELRQAHQSVQPFRTQDEYLYAMKEDLAEWLNALYDADVTVDEFFEHLENGVIICRHANNVQFHINQVSGHRRHEHGNDKIDMDPRINKDPRMDKDLRMDKNPRMDKDQMIDMDPRIDKDFRMVKDPRTDKDPRTNLDSSIQYRTNVRSGTFQSRDNISNFIRWCRHVLRIPDTLLFETDDLVLRKNERNVVLCLLEVARRGSRFGLPVPVLVQLEQEIDAEIAAEKEQNDFSSRRKHPPIKVDMKSLDELVSIS